MVWIGIDDTDSPSGGCTTYVLTEVLRAARSVGADLLGEPRLVRLNPNIPWKTRGNAALAARLGLGVGRRQRVGVLPDGPLFSYARGRPLPPGDRDRLVEAAWQAVRRNARRGTRTDPALVATSRPLPARLYWAAVRTVVPIRALERSLRELGAETRTLGSRRGLVGASAAIAWPARRATWELIAYRHRSRLGQPRDVDAESVRTAERLHPTLFLCTDPRTRRVLVTPHTACPILFGLRSTRRAPLPGALALIRSEPYDRWVVFRTNQATGDHLPERADGPIGPYEPGRTTGTVGATPLSLRGGHVSFPLLRDGAPPVPCMVFEPSKTLAEVARGLTPGDRLEVWGGRGRDPTLRVEGIRILDAPDRPRGRTPPRCPDCDRSAGSLGSGRGYRCPGCHRHFPPEAGVPRFEAARFGPGTYHPTPSARRHLHPLAEEPHRGRPPGSL
jgi:tRNA(Ile2)-agmatinylcytidine synthase